jgi:hypothetical protein
MVFWLLSEDSRFGVLDVMIHHWAIQTQRTGEGDPNSWWLCRLLLSVILDPAGHLEPAIKNGKY